MLVNDSVLNLVVFDRWIYKQYNLGDLQSEWTSFYSACLKYRAYIERAVIDQKKELLREQIDKQTRILFSDEKSGRYSERRFAI